ncbi:beta-Ig-H3/fasciclin [Nitzschia inconspicua]|uniref:Beta-Ig-H3/fasciclin n=1 Tax=Nitzschia inconspicua TaxID=303405 RepID=A0A9K3Q077_9STRA|nr:beta-Ig-H3/fasciclin [Nitzschia inconspicua]
MKIATSIALMSFTLVHPAGAGNTIRGLGIGLDPTEAPTKAPTKAPTTPSPVEAPTESFVCSICGEGKVVTNPDGVIDGGAAGTFACLEVVAAANAGLISEAQCLLLQPLAEAACGCEEEGDTVEPEEDPTDAPVDPTDAPVDPTDAPVDPTDAPVDPTDAPVDPTEAPVAPPDSCLTITETVCSLSDFSTACQLLGVFGLEEALNGGTWTVFAPTNAAFAAISDVIAGLEPDVILDILLFHAVPDQTIMSTDLAGTILQVGEGNAEPNLPTVDPADIPVCNGVIHVIDNVMIPGGILDSEPTDPPQPSDSGIAEFPTSAPGEVVLVEVFIEFDGFAPETGWEITNSTGGTVKMIPIGSYPPLTETATEDVELLAGDNYTFTIFDLFGDGLSNPEEGFYSVTQGEGEFQIVLASGGGNFGKEDSGNFTVF